MSDPKPVDRLARPIPRPCGCGKCGRIIDLAIGGRARTVKYHPDCDGQKQRKLELDRERTKRRSWAARKAAATEARERAKLRANMGNAPGRCGTCAGLPHRVQPPWCRECGLTAGIHQGDTPEFIRAQAMCKFGAER